MLSKITYADQSWKVPYNHPFDLDNRPSGLDSRPLSLGNRPWDFGSRPFVLGSRLSCRGSPGDRRIVPRGGTLSRSNN